MRGGSKKFWHAEIEIFHSPHHSIYERSLSMRFCKTHSLQICLLWNGKTPFKGTQTLPLNVITKRPQAKYWEIAGKITTNDDQVYKICQFWIEKKKKKKNMNEKNTETP